MHSLPGCKHKKATLFGCPSLLEANDELPILCTSSSALSPVVTLILMPQQPEKGERGGGWKTCETLPLFVLAQRLRKERGKVFSCVVAYQRGSGTRVTRDLFLAQLVAADV